MNPQQQITLIKVSDLRLWTENPRDPVDPKTSDNTIIIQALKDSSNKWNLKKLAQKMGEYYDFSEIPTVCYIDNNPVVFDGNCRIALAKIKLGLVFTESIDKNSLPNFPQEIPCNVCDQKTALNNVRRKHLESGTWKELERDIFDHVHLSRKKSNLLVIEDATQGAISKNPHLNQRFVKDEIFKDSSLEILGFRVNNDKFESKHSPEGSVKIFEDLSDKIKRKCISTRKNRGKILEVMDGSSRKLIDSNANKRYKEATALCSDKSPHSSQKRTRRTIPKKNLIFGGSRELKIGSVNNLYRDIEKLYEIFTKEKLSKSFIGVIRMSLRLLVEQAAVDEGIKLGKYLENHFSIAKKTLSDDQKNLLSTNNVTETSMEQLLHGGAHSYTNSLSEDKAIAMSVIIGAILEKSHGKSNE